MNIEKIKKVSDTDLPNINKLLPQLSASAQNLDHATLTNIIESDSSHVLIARENEEIFGMLTLIVFQIPTGVRDWIEDVVVSENARGKGVGRLLIEGAIRLAKENNAKTIELTSRPTREAANRLYQKIGFQQRETNVYRIN